MTTFYHSEVRNNSYLAISKSETMTSTNGSLANLKHEDILRKFRKYVESISTKNYSDEFLLRRLRAKNFDLRKAEKLFLFGINVRQTHQLDTIAETYQKPEMIEKYEFGAFLGFDKDGTPIQYISMENADCIGFIYSQSIIDLCLYCSYCVERLIYLQEKRNKEIGRHTESSISAIIDMAKFSVQQIADRTVIESSFDLMRMFQDEYPGLLKHVFVINVPSYFATILNTFRPILRMDLLERIIILSKGASASTLLKYIDANVLPVFLGGRKVDENGDPRCSSFLKFGGKIPEEDYCKNKSTLQISEPEVMEMILPARVTKDIQIQVEEEGSRLHIEMRSNHMIGLKILFREDDKSERLSYDEIYPQENYSTEELVSPYAKINCHLASVDNIKHCPRAGIYIFRFDNTFSWRTSKHVVYRIRVLPPSSSF